MSKREKLLEKLKKSSNNVTFDQVKKVLLNEDFIHDITAGSHHVFKRRKVTFVIPIHGNKVKSVYVKRVVEIIEELKNENG